MKGHLPSNPGAQGFWFTIGGGIEAGESVYEAAAREVLEETGIASNGRCCTRTLLSSPVAAAATSVVAGGRRWSANSSTISGGGPWMISLNPLNRSGRRTLSRGCAQRSQKRPERAALRPRKTNNAKINNSLEGILWRWVSAADSAPGPGRGLRRRPRVNLQCFPCGPILSDSGASSGTRDTRKHRRTLTSKSPESSGPETERDDPGCDHASRVRAFCPLASRAKFRLSTLC